MIRHAALSTKIENVFSADTQSNLLIGLVRQPKETQFIIFLFNAFFSTQLLLPLLNEMSRTNKRGGFLCCARVENAFGFVFQESWGPVYQMFLGAHEGVECSPSVHEFVEYMLSNEGRSICVMSYGKVHSGENNSGNYSIQ